ncbi:LysR family transcriptional regulator [uncultured Pseudomonas sp.]|uniref:LysR family transcriptional regulator n=1 Tax=uncultured Pseudomonas sp. TaxID=114707 RepID=UPI0025F63EDA|nr:LysR family transcriptional regulator [uncultured Pseudomonas sp.]
MSGFDLNLITTFVTLYETRSVTLTADRLCVTQPSVSYGLAKLRTQFDDVLFVRSQQGMQPTRLAMQLYEGFKEASRCIDAAVADARRFNPQTCARHFRLAMTDLGEMALLPRVLERLNLQAPGIELDIVSLEIDQVAAWLNDGHVDAAICSQSLSGAGLRHAPLVSERYCCLLDQAHPRIGAQMDMAQFLAEPHAIVTRTSGHGMAEDVLQAMGVERRVRLRIPHFSVLPRIIPGTEMITILPSRIARIFCELPLDRPLKRVGLPFEVPDFEVALYWHSRSERSTALSWFFEQIVAALVEADQK